MTQVTIKNTLIPALTPLCERVSWMNDVIALLNNDTTLPNNFFEILGVARFIVYLLILQYPNLENTESLKTLITTCANNIQVVELSEESKKIIERIHQFKNRS